MKEIITNSNIAIEITKDSLQAVVASKAYAHGREDKDDAFFVADLSDLVKKHKVWKSLLPRVEPHYAVKCNDDPAVLEVLAHLGTGFDCASKAEIQKILDLKVSPSRIIYANPCKQTSHVKFAAKHGVSLMTFDNETELYKIKNVCPEAKLVLRILPPDDTKSQCQLGMKYGCHPRHATHLLQVARELGLKMVGVSFHVGSGCYDPVAFAAAVASAKTVFEMAEMVGFHLDLLDIGGGFPGQKSAKVSFEQICAVLKPALDTYFPESCGVRIIAEPGRYFVASAFTLSVNVIAKRCVTRDGCGEGSKEQPSADDEPAFMYYVNDGVYGSFNCLLYDHAEVEPTVFHEPGKEMVFQSSIWGPTCDGLDCIKKECLLPEQDSGDWIVFKDMGAYTMCAASNFNGMPKPCCYYVARECFGLQVYPHTYKRMDKRVKDKHVGFHCVSKHQLVSWMKTGHEVHLDLSDAPVMLETLSCSPKY